MDIALFLQSPETGKTEKEKVVLEILANFALFLPIYCDLTSDDTAGFASI